jgi:aryl-alcohol dehydrogenase-like predicted oxidoreductase/predicted kinase
VYDPICRSTLSGLPISIGLGAMRLSTDPQRDDDRSVAVIHAALDAGATLIDTADVYCHNELDIGHNERLIAEALRRWPGDRSRIVVATKGGLRRPNGAWVNDGRAKHLRAACEASRQALGVDRIDMYQLHAVDPRTAIETSVRTLAALRDEGQVERIGLCNVTVGEIERARAITEITSVQVSLSVLDAENLHNGVAEYCRDNGIRVIAFRPLGGERVKRLTRDPVLARVAAKHGVAAPDVALAWLMTFGDVVPIPGATQVSNAAAIRTVLTTHPDSDDVAALDERFSGRLLRVPRSRRRPPDDAIGDVVIVMGMPGAGKSTIARDLEVNRYQRLNRDALGGSLADLVPRLSETIEAGNRHVILDNTYPTRRSRNEVIEAAWALGVPVRCVWLTTSIGDAQINAIERMIDVHGSLPTPEEIRSRSPHDTRYLLPDAQFRYERLLEPPRLDEGFTSIEERSFIRAIDSRLLAGAHRALLFDADDLTAEHQGRLAELAADGWLLFAHAWRPPNREFKGSDPLNVAVCVHPAGPPVCWCRKPIPGSVIEFALSRDVSLQRSIVVGRSSADRTMAGRLGATFVDTESFIAGGLG